METSKSKSLLRDRGFRGLFLAQLLGAFNDNLFKILVSLLAINAAAVGHSGGYLSLVGAVFMAPYLIFSGYAGYAADVCDKRRVLIVVKAFEIVIMALAFAALICGRIDLLLSVLFLLGAQATFFSPAKYGIVPEILPEVSWSRANGLLEFGRYAAVILGTALGGLVLLWWGDQPVVIGLLMIGIAVAGFATSLTIAAVPRSGADKRFRLNPWSEVAIGLHRLAGDAGLVSAVAGITFFEFAGALVLLDLLLVGKEAMGLDDGSTGSLGAFAGLGIGIGSVAAGRLSRGRVEIGLVPFGAVGVGLGVITLSAAAVSYVTTAGTLLLIGFSGGLIVVPLYAALQKQASGAERGHLISTNNFLNMAAVLLSSGALWLLRDVLEIESTHILLIAGLIIISATFAALWAFPAFATSAVAWARSLAGRLEQAGRGRGALLRNAVVILALVAVTAQPAAAQDARQTLLFAVKHQLFGDIGTVEIEIDRAGAETRVRTSIDIRAAMLGLTLRRINGECHEVWRDGQLLRFASAITTNGSAHAVRATFDGAHLVIETAEGRVYAPPNAQPENPWSLRYTQATTILSPETGEPSAVEVLDLGTEPVNPTAGSTPTHHYLVRGEAEQHLYFDASGLPLKLIHTHPTGKVTLVRINAKAADTPPVAPARLAQGAPK